MRPRFTLKHLLIAITLIVVGMAGIVTWRRMNSDNVGLSLAMYLGSCALIGYSPALLVHRPGWRLVVGIGLMFIVAAAAFCAVLAAIVMARRRAAPTMAWPNMFRSIRHVFRALLPHCR
jgi:hypothetical protein